MTILLAIALAALQGQDDWAASAKAKYEKRDYKGAEADFSRAIELDPKNAQLYLKRGDARFGLRDWDKAVEDYSRAMELAPDKPIPVLNRAGARWRKGDRDGAEKDFAKAIELDPKSPGAYAQRGQMRDGAGNLDGALEDFNKASQFRTADPQVYVSRGRILFFTKKAYGKGLQDFDFSIRMAPQYPWGYLFRGFAGIDLDENDEAIEDLTRAIELLQDADAAAAYHARATARQDKGDRAGAVADLSKAIQLDGSSGHLYHGRGCVRFDQGDWAKAVEDFRTGSRLAPEVRDYAQFRIWICRARLGEREAATKELQDYLKDRKPKDAEDWPGKVGAFLAQALPEKEFRAAAKKAGEHCEAAFYAGTIRLLDGARDAAKTCFKDCVKTNKYSFFEYRSAVAALESLAPGPRRPPVRPARMKIEILHVPGACAALEKDGCRDVEHWRHWIDEVEYPERERFFAEVRRQGILQKGELESSYRLTLLWAPAKAPFAPVADAITACARAGITRYAPIAFRSEGIDRNPAPDPKATTVEKEWQAGDKDISISVAWVKGVVQKRVGTGPWVSDDHEAMLEILEAGATTAHTVLLDVAPDVPYAVALSLHRLCRSWKLQEADFQIPFYKDPGPRTWGAVTAQEAEQFGRSLEEAVASGDADAWDRAVAWQEMLRRMIGNATLSGPMQRLVEGSYRFHALSAKKLVKAEPSSRPLKLLRIKTVEGRPCPFFRVLSKDMYDYAELELGKGKDGAILVLDVRSLNTDGSESQFFRRICLPRGKYHLDILNQLKAPIAEDVAASYQECWQLNELVLEKKFEEALKFFDDNRAALKHDKLARRSHVGIARSVGPEAVDKAIADFEQDLPGDALLPMLRIERAKTTRKWEEAHAAVQKLEEIVGEDAYLTVMRADIDFSRGRGPEAKAWAFKAVEQEPTLDRCWWMLLNTSVGVDDSASAVRALNALEGKLKITLPDLEKAPGFERFVQSREYREWKNSRQ
jgi:tetratricopeptide (TPR) repeat protein